MVFGVAFLDLGFGITARQVARRFTVVLFFYLFAVLLHKLAVEILLLIV